jgi:hypothetical protein
MKKKLVLGFLAGVAAGALPSKLVVGGKDTFRLEVQNAQLVVAKSRLEDGGFEVQVPFRACGYLYPADAGPDPLGHVGEPCWTGNLGLAEAEGVFRAMLDRYDGGVSGSR